MIKPWLRAWLGGALIGVANGVLREATYANRVGEQAGHQLSAVTGIAGFFAYFTCLQRRWPLTGAAEARRVGAAWLMMTIAFEFIFGRLVARQSWEELLADYNLAKGRTWPLVLLWIAAGPDLTRRLLA